MRGRVLIISPLASHPQEGGASLRIFMLGRLLQSAGFLVHFLWSRAVGEVRRQTTAMAAAWDDLHTGPTMMLHRHRLNDSPQPQLSGLVWELHRRWRFNAVLCHFVWLSDALAELDGDTLKLIDTHEVFAGRHERLRGAGQGPEGLSISVAEEMSGLARADIVLAGDEDTATLFRARGHPDVRVLGHLAPMRMRLVRTRDTLAAGYFGSAKPLNHAAFRALQAHLPHAPRQTRLFVAGSICDRLGSTAPFSRVGYLNDATAFYDQVDLAINPADTSTGIAVKSVEAMSHGVPLIATRAAMVGLPSYHTLHRLDGSADVAAILRETRFGTTLRTELAAASRRAAQDYAATVRGAARDLIEAIQ